MKYYSLNYNSFNEAETGTQFQSTEGYCGDIQNDLPFENPIINKFELPIPIMKSKAIETSLLSVTFIPSWFLVLDDDFFNFLTKFNTKFQTWKIDVYKKKEKISNYNLYYMYETKQRNIIDFSNSFFYESVIGENVIGTEIKIKNYDEYLKINNTKQKINSQFLLRCEKLRIDLSKENSDFFRMINVPLSGYFVSEKLKFEIEEQRFTGLVFKEIEKINDKLEVIY